MELRKISINKHGVGCRGFTLIEVLVVMGLIITLLGITLFFDINMYRGDAFRAEREILVTALQSARADALNNIDQKRHGVAINPDGFEGYVVFSGSDYENSEPETRKEIPASYTVELDPSSPTEIVFKQLSGDANYNGEIILVDPNRNATTSILINSEGKIGS